MSDNSQNIYHKALTTLMIKYDWHDVFKAGMKTIIFETALTHWRRIITIGFFTFLRMNIITAYRGIMLGLVVWAWMGDSMRR